MRKNADEEGGANNSKDGREKEWVRELHGVRILSDTGDFDRKAFTANRADCRIGRRDISVTHRGPDCSGETLNVGLVSGLATDDGESVHRLYA